MAAYHHPVCGVSVCENVKRVCISLFVRSFSIVKFPAPSPFFLRTVLGEVNLRPVVCMCVCVRARAVKQEKFFARVINKENRKFNSP